MLNNLNNYVITDEELLVILNRELEIIQEYCQEETPENIPPILKVIDSENRLQFISLDTEEDFNKAAKRRQILFQIGAAFYREWGQTVFPIILILTSEAWMKSFDANAIPDKVRAPSDYPDAIDAIVIQAITLAKSSQEETESNPRAGLAVLEIKTRQPYIHAEKLLEPQIMPATMETTDLLNHFFIGWFQESKSETN